MDRNNWETPFGSQSSGHQAAKIVPVRSSYSWRILQRMPIRTVVFTIGLSMLATAARVEAHHHVGCVYDTAASQTLAGRIVEIVWRFPHVHIRLDSGTGPVDRREWDVETLNPQGLRRDGVQSETLKVGDMLITTSCIARDGSRQAFSRTKECQLARLQLRGRRLIAHTVRRSPAPSS
jgi:hypothetical protein